MKKIHQRPPEEKPMVPVSASLLAVGILLVMAVIAAVEIRNAIKAAETQSFELKTHKETIQVPTVTNIVPRVVIEKSSVAPHPKSNISFHLPQLLNIGKVDLTPTIVAVGIMEAGTDTFIASSTMPAASEIGVTFFIENVGTADSGPWSFSAVLPTFPMRIYESDIQLSLAPSERAHFTLGFEKAMGGEEGNIVINVDPANQISEASETNNVAKMPITPSN